jgi:hypothetical protein
VVCGAGELEEAYHGWLARHGFVPKMRRCRPIIINVGTRGFLASECPAYLSGIPSIGGTASFCRFSARKKEPGKEPGTWLWHILFRGWGLGFRI